MYRLTAILVLCACLTVSAQDTTVVDKVAEPEENVNFGEKIKDKFNITEKLELFSIIASSKAKCDQLVIDDTKIWEQEGKVIRSVNIQVLDPFEHIDTESLKRPKFFKMANGVHRTTTNRIIEQQLLFKEGEQLDPAQIVASNEILYDNSYFRDAIIYVEPAEDDNNAVDIYVLVQDLWSWSFWGNVTGDYVGGSLVFNKFAGLPQSLIGGMNFNYDKKNPVTPSLIYKYNNIKGSFVKAKAYWSHDWRNFTYQAAIKRGFFSSKPQWAGGLRSGFYRTYHEGHDDRSYQNQQDLWLARSFELKVKNKEFMNIVVAGRAMRNHYTSTPIRPTEEGNVDPFINTHSYYFGIGVTNRQYVPERNIFDFFPYRNLPTGFNMHVIGGMTYNETHATRGYVGLATNHSLMTCAGYFQEEFAGGTFIDNGLEQITISLKSKYFTHKFPLRKWGLRQYVYQSLVYGLQRPEGENVVINNGGIKGIRFKDYEGSSYYTVNLETEIYSPIKFIGFQARIFAFADFGLQGNRSDIPLASPRVYQAYGLGFRLNNWKLGIAFLEFSFVYYPNTTGLENRPFEISQNYYNSKVIWRNNLYNWNAVGPVN